MPEQEQEERAYRLFTLDETPELADLNPDVEISPDNVGKRIIVPVKEKGQQIPNHHWRIAKEEHDKTCDLYEGRLGSVLVSVPNQPLKQVRPDLSYFGDTSPLFYPCPYYVNESVVPSVDATIQDGRLEKVREIILMDKQILAVRSAIVDAIQEGTKTAHFLINHPYRKYHTEEGDLIAFKDQIAEDRMVAVIINDVRLHKTIDEVLSARTPRELGTATERTLRQEWDERMRTEQQASDFHGLKSFKLRQFPRGIPVTASKKK